VAAGTPTLAPPRKLAGALLAVFVLAFGTARAEPDTTARRKRDCDLSLLGFCLADSEASTAAPTRFRLESMAGIKFANFYYGYENDNCRKRGCRLDFTGVSGTLELSYNLAGNPHGDDYWDLGLAVSYMPLVSIRNNVDGFRGSRGEIAAGDGELGYLSVRLSLRRPSLFSLIGSKYLFTAFGVGVAVPLAAGEAARTFTGGNEAHFMLGGKIGIQGPISERFKLGFCAHWNAIWAGRDVLDFSIMTAYGLHLSSQF
jgi:hypothetical protein